MEDNTQDITKIAKMYMEDYKYKFQEKQEKTIIMKGIAEYLEFLGSNLDAAKVYDEALRLYENKPPKRKFTFITVSELLKEGEKPIEWIIEPIIAKGSNVLLGGAQGTFKSFLAILACYATAKGELWLDRFATTQGGSIYIEEENGKPVLGRRTKQLIKLEDQKILDENVHYLSYSGIKLEDGSMDFESLKDSIKEFGNIKLIVFDTFRRVTKLNEDRSEEVAKFMNDYMAPLNAMGIATLILAHTKKPPIGKNVGSFEEWGINMIRGSGDMLAAPHIVMILDRRGQDMRIKLLQGKNKYQEEIPVQVIDVEEDKANNKMRFVCKGSQTEYTMVSDCAKSILSWMKPNQVYKTSEVILQFENAETKEKTIQRALKELKTAKVIKYALNEYGNEIKGNYLKVSGGISDYVEKGVEHEGNQPPTPNPASAGGSTEVGGESGSRNDEAAALAKVKRILEATRRVEDAENERPDEEY